MNKMLSIFLVAGLLSGCSTSTYLQLPEGSELKIKRGTLPTYPEGKLTRTPLSWSSAGGIPYALEKDGEVIQEGRLRSSFRPASIFWPPAAIIYWPIGFAYKCYDLTGDVATQCSAATLEEIKARSSK